ncbi:MAG: DUF4157 domain-containing protein [Myxococcota bacterium]
MSQAKDRSPPETARPSPTPDVQPVVVPDEQPAVGFALAQVAVAGAGEPLPFEARLRAAFGPGRLAGIRAHRGPHVDRALAAVDANAFTLGQDVALSREAPLSTVAHEVTHAVLQALGHGPVGSMGHASYERHADVIAAEVRRGGSVQGRLPGRAGPALRILQRQDAQVTAGEPQILSQPIPQGNTREIRRQASEVARYFVELLVEENRISAAQGTSWSRGVTTFVLGSQLTAYDRNGRRIGRFDLRNQATVWQAGWYAGVSSGAWWLVDQGRGLVFERFGPVENTEEARLSAQVVNWLDPSERERFGTFFEGRRSPMWVLAVPPSGEGEGRDEAERRQTRRAERMVREIEARMRREAEEESEEDAEEADSETEEEQEEAAGAGGQGEEGEGAGGGGDDDETRLDEEEGDGEPAPGQTRPDRLVVWRRESDGQLFVNVWVDGGVVSVPINTGEATENLERRIQEAADALARSRDPSQSERVDNDVDQTGFVGGMRSDQPEVAGGERRANAPAYPARIRSFGPDITVVGATSRFEMVLDYAPAGGRLLDQVAARLQPINFYWELLDVSNVRPAERSGVVRGRPVGSGRQATPAEESLRQLEQGWENVVEDTQADLQDVTSGPAPLVVATWQARSAWLGVVGISNVVRLGGSLISSYVTAVTTPRNERGVAWDQQGEFLVRCVATPEAGEDAQVIRASSVAAVPIKVQTVQGRAESENNRILNEIADLKQELASTTDEARRASLQRRIDAMERADQATASEGALESMELVASKLAVARALSRAERNRTPREERSDEVRLLAAQLALLEIPITDYIQQLEGQHRELASLRRRALQAEGQISGPNYRPQVTLASEENGMVTQFILLLGEVAGSREGRRRYVLADVTSQRTRGYYTGSVSTRSGLAGHNEAIRNAFVDFRENAEYGRGTIAIRLPPNLIEAVGDLSIDSAMRMAPGQRARVMRRLGDLATAAALAGLLITGPVGVAIGAVGGVAGAVVAIDRLARRTRDDRFEWDFEAIMDVAAIVGGVVGLAGVGVTAASAVPRWASRVERISGLLHIYAVTDLGMQLIIIPLSLEMELRQIEEDPSLSDGQRAARRAEAVLRAVQGGLMAVGSAMQLLSAGPEPTRAPRDDADGPARVPGDESPRPRPQEEGGTTPREETAPRDGDEGARRPEGAEGRPPSEGPSARALELDALLGDASGQGRLVENPELGNGVRVRYRRGKVRLEVGPRASRRRVQQHLETLHALRRFEGPLGMVRRLGSRITEIFTRLPGYGRAGFESRFEVRKLRRMLSEIEGIRDQIQERIRNAGEQSDPLDPIELAGIEAEIAGLREQLAYHEGQIDSVDPGRGFVAADDTSGASDRARQRAREDGPARPDGESGTPRADGEDGAPRAEIDPDDPLQVHGIPEFIGEDLPEITTGNDQPQQRLVEARLRLESLEAQRQRLGEHLTELRRLHREAAVDAETIRQRSLQAISERAGPGERAANREAFAAAQERRDAIWEEIQRLRVSAPEPPPGGGRRRLSPFDTLAAQTRSTASEVARLEALLDPHSRGRLPCFEESTLVHTPDGPVPIHSIEVGSLVLAWQPGQGVVARPVSQVHQGKTRAWWRVTTAVGEVLATAAHPFRVGDRWVAAQSLEVGARLVGMNGEERPVVSHERIEALDAPTWNLSVEGAQTFFVGEGVLVHNTPLDLGFGGSQIVYRGTNPRFPGVVYIGRTVQGLETRETSGHHSEARRELRRSDLTAEQRRFFEFKSATNPDGSDGFRIEAIVVGMTTEDQAAWVEQLNMDFERDVAMNELINRREEISSQGHRDAVAERIGQDSDVRAAGYCL